MSIYTTEVRFICETYAGYKESQGYDKVNEIVASAQSKIFELYPIFDESYRSVLNTKILRHYYTREICAETVGLWKLWLNNKMTSQINLQYQHTTLTTHCGEWRGSGCHHTMGCGNPCQEHHH